MISWAEARLRQLRRLVSRSEWVVRLLGLPRSEGTTTKAGLVLIQIDGLARHQLERALADGQMPFLRKLHRREHYQLHTFYSGIPSSTPAVQGELFYGVRCAVPAFGFRDNVTGQMVKMFDPTPASSVETELARQGDPLLRDGAAYSNIYTGGATEAYYCSASMGLDSLLYAVNPLTWLSVIVWHLWTLVRVIGLTLLELALAFYDVIEGIIGGQRIWPELAFIPARVVICIILRELVTIGGVLDATRGSPVIHLNYLGYDEQAHRRGPSSAFAHWTLRGIDRSIKQVWTAARRSHRRDYDIWIYSDHGQEHSTPYSELTGRSLQDAVDAALTDIGLPHDLPQRHHASSRGERGARAQWLGPSRLARVVRGRIPQDENLPRQRVVVADLGPVAHIYLSEEVDGRTRVQLAKQLVQEYQVPLVAYVTTGGQVCAHTMRGEYELPRDWQEVLGEDHPIGQEAAEDVAYLLRHASAGDLVAFGWCRGADTVSFADENGSHAGCGPKETSGFALLPPDAPVPHHNDNYIRGLDLRAGALHRLGRGPLPDAARRTHLRRVVHPLRIMTYNVHSCIGNDGKISTERIARVIAQYDPDVVALQELDVGRIRSGGIDQAHRIAQRLEMDFHFHPSLRVEEEHYGNAILSRFPMRLLKAGALPGHVGKPHLEPRGALAVEISGSDWQITLINTHLGLNYAERLAQIDELLSRNWLHNPEFPHPAILLGDFNALPGSQVYKRAVAQLRDAQQILENHRPQATYYTRRPLGRIDHVFCDEGIQVQHVEIPRTQLTSIASDHLPLIVDLTICSDRLSEESSEATSQGLAS